MLVETGAQETQRIYNIRGILAVTDNFTKGFRSTWFPYCIQKLIGYCYLREAGKLMTGSLRHFKIKETKLILMLMEYIIRMLQI